MKILNIINNLNTGGAEKLLLESLPIFKEKGVPVDLLLLNYSNSIFLEEIKKNKNLKIYYLSSLSIYNPYNIFKIIPFLKKYNIVHAHLFPSIYWTSIARLISFSTCKLVMTEHSSSNRRRKYQFFKYIDKFIYGKYDRIITISKDVDISTKNHINLPHNKLKLIYNGINISNITNSSPCFDPSIIKFLGPNSKVVIQISRFQEPKDQATLINSIALLPSHVKLLLVGDGELKYQSELLVNKLQLSNRVKFLGIRIDVPQLLKLADIVVLSTKHEGLSLSSIEGLASGRPFIGSDVPGLSEVVENAGILFPQGNEKNLACSINRLLSDKQYYDKISKACVERSKLYDIKHMADKYISLYWSLV
jgi:glycosyltransferase involved in cell wall biosynthesis